MALENLSGAGSVDSTGAEQPADDIRSAITAAIATREADADVAPTKSVAIAKPKASAEPGGSEAIGGDDGEAGKSEPKEKQPSKAKSSEPKDGDDADPEKAATAKADSEKAEAAKAEAAITGRWSAKDKETLKSLPPEGRELILRRHKEMEGAFNKKIVEHAAFRKEYEPVDKIFEPYRDQMKASGYTPQSLIQAWANVEDRLMKGDGVAVVAGLINGYKVDLGKVAQALGIRPRQSAPAPQDQNGSGQPPGAEGSQIQLPPELVQTLQALTNRQSELDRRIATEDRRRADEAQRAQQTAVQRVQTELETFKSAKTTRAIRFTRTSRSWKPKWLCSRRRPSKRGCPSAVEGPL